VFARVPHRCPYLGYTRRTDLLLSAPLVVVHTVVFSKDRNGVAGGVPI